MVIKPNFLIIGAQRAGTTWLWENLRRHSEVYLPQPKELEFFSYKDKLKDPGFEGYLQRHFSAVTNQTAVGEATPSYLWNSDAYPEWCKKPAGLQPNIPKLVNNYLGPETKLLVILRNPADRAVSAYFHHIATGLHDGSKNIFSIGKKGGIIHLGFYFEHIAKWFEVFEYKNFKILIFEEVMQNPKKTYEEVCKFLNINSSFIPASLYNQYNLGIPLHNNGNCYLFRKRKNHLLVKALILGDGYRMVVSKEDYAKLVNLYTADITKLEDLLNKDLSVWRTNQRLQTNQWVPNQWVHFKHWLRVFRNYIAFN